DAIAGLRRDSGRARPAQILLERAELRLDASRIEADRAGMMNVPLPECPRDRRPHRPPALAELDELVRHPGERAHHDDGILGQEAEDLVYCDPEGRGNADRGASELHDDHGDLLEAARPGRLDPLT